MCLRRVAHLNLLLTELVCILIESCMLPPTPTPLPIPPGNVAAVSHLCAGMLSFPGGTSFGSRCHPTPHTHTSTAHLLFFCSTLWFYIVEIVLAPAFVGLDREGVEHLPISMGWGIEKGGGGRG